MSNSMIIQNYHGFPAHGNHESLRAGTGSLIAPFLADFQKRILSSNPGEVIELQPMSTSNQDVSTMLRSIKEISGLSWNKIAQLLGVSRQAIYDWIEGKSITPEHHQTTIDLSNVFQRLEHSKDFNVRTFILCGQYKGLPIMDVLKRGDYELFIELFNRKEFRQHELPRKLDVHGLDNLSIEDRVSLREDGPITEESTTRVGKADRRE